MQYVIAPNGVYASTVQTTGSVLWDANHFCPASALTPDEAEMFGVYPLLEAAQPACGIAETAVAQDLEYNAISGSAVGLLAIGVMQGAPKCVAVQNWIKGIWALYYERKVNGDASTDYSICGTCPHSVPELMAELGF